MPADDWVLRLKRGRQQQSREQVVTSQRVQLLDAMTRTVAEKGYAATTVADVADRAGVPHATFLEHFPDTESCFLAAYDMGVDVLVTTVQDGLGPPESPPLDRYERLLVSYLDLLAAEPAFARTFMIEIYAAGPRAVQRRREVLDRFTDLLAEIFGPLRDEGGELDRFACEAFVGAINSLVTTRVAAGEFEQLQELREPIMGLARRLLTPHGEDAATFGAGVDLGS